MKAIVQLNRGTATSEGALLLRAQGTMKASAEGTMLLTRPLAGCDGLIGIEMGEVLS